MMRIFLATITLLAAVGCSSSGGGTVDTTVSPSDDTPTALADVPISPSPPDTLAGPDGGAPDLPVAPDLYTAPPLAATRVRYDMAVRPMVLPFPYDRYTAPDPSSRNGTRVHVNDDEFSNSIIAEALAILTPFKDVINLVDGFGPYQWCSAEIVGRAPLDWRATATGEPVTDGPVRLLAWDGARVLGDVPFSAQIVERTARDGTAHQYLDLLPLRPLPDGGRHLVVITTALADDDGEAIGPDLHFLVVAGRAPLPEGDPALAALLETERGRMAPAFAAVNDAGIATETLAVLYDFTVAHARADMLAVADLFERDAALRDVAFTFDADGDGVDDVRRPGEPGFIGDSPLNSVALSVTGTFPRQDFRHPDHHDGAFRLGEDGVPLPSHEEPISFWMTFPAEPAGGPWPVVILLHGIDSDRDQVKRFAAALAAKGLVAFAYDLPEHGDDHDGKHFLPFDKVFATRDNFRQAGVDLLTATYLVDRWMTEGIPLEGIGPGNLVFLKGPRVGLMGHSLGAMCGLVGGGLRAQPEALVLGVGGGGMHYFVGSYLRDLGLDRLLPGPVLHGLEILTGLLLAPGDPINYAAVLRPDPLPATSRPRQVLLMEMLGDLTMHDDILESTAVALSLPHYEPILRPLPALEVVTSGATHSGFVQYEDGEHGFRLGGPDPELTARAQAQMFHYLATFLETGEAEIIHPWVFPDE